MPDHTAIAQVVIELARLSDPSSYQYSAWFLTHDGPLRRDLEELGVDVSYRPWLGKRDLRGSVAALTAMRSGRFDIVHCHTGGRTVRWLARLGTSARIIAHVHAGSTEAELLVPASVATDGAHLVIANSAASSRRVKGKPVRVVHPGVRIELFPLCTDPPGNVPIIGAVSRLVPIKGLQFLLGAVALLRANGATVALEIVGDGPERASLEAHASRLGITEHVRFLGWQPDVATLHRRWAVFGQPSLEEGFGLATLEAMASGLPVVATRVGGLAELVCDGVTGSLFPPGDEDALARALEAVLVDQARARQMGLAGRERATELFSAESMVVGILAAYVDSV